ncbi:MAG: amidohydrolase [Xanthomonadales bacterium]|nr:amidohydrolase [Xanthomonadales bacterium]
MNNGSAGDIIGFRRRLHARPELSERENGTAAAIVERLSPGRPERIVEGLGAMRTGVCSVYDSGVPGPTVLLRCELDALPIQERNDFAHRSVHDGVSHKCGHDGHMATLVAVGDGLAAQPPRRGRLYLLFQPAEETGTGAQAVLDDPAFRALPPPDYVYAFHNVPKFPLGQVLLRRGPFAQGSVGFVVEFRGVTSHSSYPEHGVNPSSAVTALIAQVNGLDTLMTDKTNAPVLGTVTYAEIGAAGNGPNFGISPGQARVCGVLRAQNNADLALLRAELAGHAADLAAQAGLTHQLSWHEEFAVTESHDECVAVVAAAAKRLGLSVSMLEQPFRWSEDFGYFTSRYTGAFFGLGSGSDQPQLHDDGYDYPDELIAHGASLYRAIIDAHLNDGENADHG